MVAPATARRNAHATPENVVCIDFTLNILTLRPTL
jgi:hypothetical protein